MGIIVYIQPWPKNFWWIQEHEQIIPKKKRKNSYVNAWRGYVSFDNDVKVIGSFKNMPKNIVGFGPQ